MTGAKNITNKSAILSYLNLNNKAREDLEKRKQKNKEAAAKLTASSPPVAQTDSATEKTDTTLAIPITSYTSYNDDDEDEDDDDEEDNQTEKTAAAEKEAAQTIKNNIKIDLKRKSDALIKNKDVSASTSSSQTSVKKAKKKEIGEEETKDDDEDDDEETPYFNVFKSTAEIPPKAKARPAITKPISSLKMNVKKQPIIKAGQTQKDREEITLSFIGIFFT